MKILISKITVDADTQVRTEISSDVVAAYAERMTEGDVFPPISVFSDGNRYILADGFHRVMAAKRNGFTDIEANVLQGAAKDALWYSLGANRANGQRLNRGDLTHAITIAIKTWPDKTQADIAEQVGCSQSYVAKVKSDYHSDIETPKTIKTARGQTRPTSYKKAEPTVEAVKQQAIKKEEGAYTEGKKPEAGRDHLADMKRAWKSAGKAEREKFCSWVDKERGADLPKVGVGEIFAELRKLQRMVKTCPAGVTEICNVFNLQKRGEA